jgi:hypothetical protein
VQQQLDILITGAGVVATESEIFATPAADLRVERRGGMVTAAIARRGDTSEVWNRRCLVVVRAQAAAATSERAKVRE